jgi:hypothetical protein
MSGALLNDCRGRRSSLTSFSLADVDTPELPIDVRGCQSLTLPGESQNECVLPDLAFAITRQSGHYACVAGTPGGAAAQPGPLFRSDGSAIKPIISSIPLFAFAVFAGVMVAQPFGLLIAAGVSLFGLCAIGFMGAYSATVMADGEVHFRSLFRHKVVPASDITEIRIAYGGEYGSAKYLVIQLRRGSVRMSATDRNVEMARCIKRLNPAIVLDV